MGSVQCAGILITLDTWGSRTRRTSNVRKGLKWFKGLKKNPVLFGKGYVPS